MANNQGRIGFSIDFKKGDMSGLSAINQELTKIQNLTSEGLKLQGIDVTEAELKKIKTQASELQQILTKSYNFKLNSVDLEKLQQNLKASGTTLASMERQLKKLGPAGAASFANINANLYKTQKLLKETHPLMDKMKETFANTVRWTIASTAINSFTGSIQKAWNFTKQLDTSLNNIQVVTEKSSDEMRKFAKEANKAAKELGVSTKSYTDASLIYYQQGLSDADTKKRTDVTAKVANVTGQSASTVSEQLTAIWNGYKVSAQEAELYIDKVSAVAATTAADLEELATGMSKVASAANIMGVDIDQLNAQLATIVSVTREAPESIGTALKTVYARMSDIQAGLDGETTLDEYTEQMAEMGIKALDANGQLRDQGEVIEEIGEKWNTLSRNQQVSLAQTIAGTRQYSRMMALFDNWNMYEQAKITSQNSEGVLNKQNEIKLDSLETKLQQVTTATEELYLVLFNNESFKSMIDGFTSLIGLVTDFIEGLGGAKTLLLTLGGIGGRLLSDKISSFVGTNVKNREINKQVRAQKQISLDETVAVEEQIAQREAFNKNRGAASKVARETNKKQAELEKIQSQIDKLKSEQTYSEGEGPSAEAEEIDKLTESYNRLKQELDALSTKQADLAKEREKITNPKRSLKELEEEKRIAQERAAIAEKNGRARKILSDEEYQARLKRQKEIEDSEVAIAVAEKAKQQAKEEAEKKISELKKQRTKDIENALQKELKAEQDKNSKIIAEYKVAAEKKKKIDTIALALGVDADKVDNKDAAKIALTKRASALTEHGKNIDKLSKDSPSEEIASALQHELEYLALGEDNAFKIAIETAINNIKEENVEAQKEAVALIKAEIKKQQTDIKDAEKLIESDEDISGAEIDEEQIAKLKKKADDARDANATIVNDEEAALERIKEKNAQTIEKIKEGYQDQVKAAREASKETQAEAEAQIQKEKNKQEVLKNDQSLEDKVVDAELATRAVVKLTSSVAMLGAGLSALSNIPSIFNNDDLTAGEKLLQIIGSLGTAIPTTINGAKQLKESFSDVTDIVKKSIEAYAQKRAAQMASVATTNAEVAAETAKTVSSGADTVATGVNTVAKALNTKTEDEVSDELQETEQERKDSVAALTAETVALEANTLAKKKNSSAGGSNKGNIADKVKDKVGDEIQDELVDKGGDLIEDALTKDEGSFGKNVLENLKGEKFKGAKGAFKEGAKNLGSGVKKAGGKFVSKGKSALKGVGKVAKAIGPGGAVAGAAVIASAAAIGFSIKAIVDYRNQEKNAVEEAKKDVESLTAVADAQQKKFAEVSNAVKSYNDLGESMKEMTKGSKEWNDALRQNNEQVMELVDKYPELGDAVETVDGQMIIDQEKLVEFEEKEQDKVERANSQKYSAQARQKEAENDLVYDQGSKLLKTSIDGWQEAGAAMGGAFVGAGVGYGIGAALAAIPVVGTIAGAITMAATTIGAATVGAAQAGIAMAKANEAMNDANVEAAIELYNENSAVFESAGALSQALQDSKNMSKESADKLAAAVMENREAMIDLANEVRLNTEAMKLQKDQASREFINSTNNSAFENSLFQDSIVRLFTNKTEGFKDEAITTVKNMSKEDFITAYATSMGYTRTNTKGNITKHWVNAEGEEIDPDTLAQEWKDKEGSIVVNNIAKELATAELGSFIREMEHFNGILGQVTEDGKNKFINMEKVLANWSAGITTSIENLSYSEMLYVLNERADLITTSNQEDLLDAQTEKIYDILESVNASLMSENGVFTKAINDYSFNINKEQAEAISRLWSSFDNSDYFSSEIGEFLKTFGAYADDINLLMTQINWGDENAINSFIDGMAKIDSSLLENERTARMVGEKLKILHEAQFFSVEKMQEITAKIHEVTVSIEGFGDTISADDFNALSTEMQQYFIRMADGTYALTIAAGEFRDVVKAAAAEKFKTDLEALVATHQGDITRKETLEAQISNFNVQEARNSVSTLKYAKEQIDAAQQEIDDNSKYTFTQAATDFQNNDSTKDWDGVKADPNQVAKLYAQVKAVLAIPGQTLIDDALASDLIDPKGGDNVIPSDLGVNDGKYFRKSLMLLFTAASLIQKGADSQTSALNTQISTYEQNTSELEEIKGRISSQDADMLSALDTRVAAVTSEQEIREAVRQYLIASGQEVTNANIDTVIQQQGYDKYLKYFDDAENRLIKSLDTYNALNAAIDKLARSYNKLGQTMERVSKAQQPALIEEQNKNLEEQIQLAEQQLEYEKTTGLYNAKAGLAENLGQGMFSGIATEWDLDGSIIGYASVEDMIADVINGQGEVDWLKANEWIEQVARTADSESARILEEALRAFESEQAQRIADAEQNVFDKETEWLNNNLSKLQVELELQLNTSDAQRSYQDFLRNTHLIAEDDFSGLMESYITDYQTYLDDAENQMQHLNNLQKDLAAGRISAAQFEEEYAATISELQSLGVSLTDMQAQLEEIRLNSLEAISEEYDKQAGYIENINSLLDQQMEMLNLLYGDGANAAFAMQVRENYAAKTANAIATQSAAQSDFAFWQEEWQKVAEQEDSEYKDYVLEQLSESTDAYISAVLATATARQEEYMFNLDQALKKFKTESMGDEWNWMKEDSELYLSEIEKAYGLADLASSFNKAINSSNDIKTQQRINDLRETELEYLREEDKISQYQLDRAQAKLEILQAQIALEDAQANKTAMRLTRGADGTYSYQYVADTTAIEEKEEQLRKANQALYQLDEEEYKSQLDEFYSLYQEYVEKMRTAYEDGVITDEESESLTKYEERLTTLADKTMFAQSKLKESTSLTAEILGKQIGEFAGYGSELEKTIENIFKQGGIREAFDEVFNGKEGEKGITAMASDYYAEAEKGLTTINELLQGKEGEGGMLSLYSTLATNQNEAIKRAKDEKLEVDELLGSIKNMNDAYTITIGKLKELSQEYVNYANIQAVSGANASKAFSKFVTKTDEGYYQLNMDGESAEWRKTIDEFIGIAAGKDNKYMAQVHEWWNSRMRQKEGLAAFVKRLTDNDSITEKEYQNFVDFLDAFGILNSFDTGGYTGEWDNSGRLAMLHEKELVLNQEDTSNMLKAVDIVRSLQSELDVSMMHRIADMMKSYETTMAALDLLTQTELEQNVHIQAEFPNVTNSKEIEEAFDELINLATQKIYENKR